MNIKDFQKIEKIMLKKLKEVFEKYDIKYYITFGTLLGAVRHKDLIPWDDDVDIWISREGFEKLKRLPQNIFGSNMYIDYGNNLFCDFIPRLVYNEVEILSKEYEEIGDLDCMKYPVIDFFILDNEFDNSILRNFRKLLLIITYGEALGHRKNLNYKKYSWKLKPIIFVLSHIGKIYKLETLRRKYEKYSMLCKNDNSIFLVSANDVFPSGFDYRYSRKCFESDIELEIDGEKYNSPIGYHEILKLCYTENYMSLPKEQERVPKHRILEGEI